MRNISDKCYRSGGSGNHDNAEESEHCNDEREPTENHLSRPRHHGEVDDVKHDFTKTEDSSVRGAPNDSRDKASHEEKAIVSTTSLSQKISQDLQSHQHDQMCDPIADAARETKCTLRPQQQRSSFGQRSKILFKNLLQSKTEKNHSYRSITCDGKQQFSLRLNQEDLQSEKRNPPDARYWSLTSNQQKTIIKAGGMLVVAGGCIVTGYILASTIGAVAGYQVGKALLLGACLADNNATTAAGVGTVMICVASAANKSRHQRIVDVDTGNIYFGETVLLVRPDIQIDPIWNQLILDARKLAPRRPNGFCFSVVHTDDRKMTPVDDIVMATEAEICTQDKVFLLVNRVLNDKKTLPGHVFWYLIDEFMKRCQERSINAMMIMLDRTGPAFHHDATAPPRARRDDAHAVMNHVTACVLEAYPALCTNLTLVRWTATVVESLVLAQLYDAVMEEICGERNDNIHEIDQHRFASSNVSQEAIDALQSLSKARNLVDKLFYCSAFLDAMPLGETSGADDLLPMVCCHISAAQLPDMQAQVAFIEEFVRDDSVFHGRAGYAIITLKASLQLLCQ